MSDSHDVLFYVPHAGPMLAPGSELPAGGAETQMVLVARELAQRGLRIAFVIYGDHLPASIEGIDLIPQMPPRTAVRGIRSLEVLFRTLAVLVQSGAPVVVQRNASAVTGIVALAARLTGKRFVYSSANVIDFDFDRLEPNRFKSALFRLGIKLASVVVVQTAEQVELAKLRFGLEPRLIPSGAEPAVPRRTRPTGFLWIGRLAAYKNPEAYLKLAESIPDAQFRMLGVPSGPDGARLAAEVVEHARLLDNVELLVPRPRARLGALYDDAVAVVNTAQFEGMPNIFLEAWARGVPVVALYHDPDGIIARHRLGAFAGGDQTALVDAVRALWAERHNQIEIAQRCISYVGTSHSLQATSDAWKQVVLG